MEDFFRKSFLEGGLTYDQIFFLYSHIYKQKTDEMKFQAALMGVDTEGEDDGIKKEETLNKEGLVFKDPDEYEKMTDEERQRTTEKMMEIFKPWAGQAINKGK